MFRKYFILLLLAHILGDFYIQTGKIAEEKEKSLKWVLIHCAYYSGIMLLLSLSIISWKIILGAAVAAAFHFLVDATKFVYISSINKKSKMTQITERNIFFIDQLLHCICLIGIAYWGVRSDIQTSEWEIIEDFFYVVGVSKNMFISWVLVLLIIHKPANIAIQKLLSIYKPASNIGDNKEVNNAGRFIGTLERIIMLIFLSIGQYSAIGLVLTAKSIARYDRISKEKNFAEYYLLGTLISTVVAIVVSFIL